MRKERELPKTECYGNQISSDRKGVEKFAKSVRGGHIRRDISMSRGHQRFTIAFFFPSYGP